MTAFVLRLWAVVEPYTAEHGGARRSTAVRS